MPNLPDKNNCCGCSACIDSCAKNAITLELDRNGFYYPVINHNLCVECKACEWNCHILHQDEIRRNDRNQETLFSCWTTDKDLLRRSASGGAFAQLASDFLEIGDSLVVGAELGKDGLVRLVVIDKKEDLWKLQQSKYEQCRSEDIYKSVKKKLSQGKRVLFSGLPCQIAALYHFLHYKNLERLFTIEILCHGVPSRYLTDLALRIKRARSIHSYRTKSKGWYDGNRTVYAMSDGKIIEEISTQKDFRFKSYLTYSCLRKSCYGCRYATMDRVADLSLGDFWYGGEDKSDYQNYDGTSLVIVNSSKGDFLWKRSEKLIKIPVSFEMATRNNQAIYMPTSTYPLILSDDIYKIKKMPVVFQAALFQNGFTNSPIRSLLFKMFFFPLRRVKAKEKAKLTAIVRRKELDKLKNRGKINED